MTTEIVRATAGIAPALGVIGVTGLATGATAPVVTGSVVIPHTEVVASTAATIATEAIISRGELTALRRVILRTAGATRPTGAILALALTLAAADTANTVGHRARTVSISHLTAHMDITRTGLFAAASSALLGITATKS